MCIRCCVFTAPSSCDISGCKANTSGWVNKHALIRVCNEYCAHTRTHTHRHIRTNTLVCAKWLKCLPDTVEPLSFTFEFCFSTYFSKNYTQTTVTRQQTSLCIAFKCVTSARDLQFFLWYTLVLFRWPVSIAAAIRVVMYLYASEHFWAHFRIRWLYFITNS